MHSEEAAIFQIVGYSDEQLAKKFLTFGGSIRMIAITGESSPETFPTDVIQEVLGTRCMVHGREAENKEPRTENQEPRTSKITFALGTYGLEYRLSDI